MVATEKGRVVVGVDGLWGSVEALRHAADLARCRGVELDIVHVRDRVRVKQAPVPPGLVGIAPSPVRKPDLRALEAADEQARETIRSGMRMAFGGPPPGLPVRMVVGVGHPATVLANMVWHEQDLLVVGASSLRHRRLRPLHRSVSRYCADYAPCPVVTVPAGQPPESVPTGDGAPHHGWHMPRALHAAAH